MSVVSVLQTVFKYTSVSLLTPQEVAFKSVCGHSNAAVSLFPFVTHRQINTGLERLTQPCETSDVSHP